MSTPSENSIVILLKKFEKVSLKEMDKCLFMRRKDAKYLMSVNNLIPLLEDMAGKFSVLEISGIIMQVYETCYYDSEGFEMYHFHHNDRFPRLKVRKRSYVGSGLSFLEIKSKNNRRETEKIRMKSHPGYGKLEEGEKDFIELNTPFSAEALKPAMITSFKRITFVNNNFTERVTIDLGVKFRCPGANREKEFPRIAIVEVKYDV